jgi:hypothetical protein
MKKKWAGKEEAATNHYYPSSYRMGAALEPLLSPSHGLLPGLGQFLIEAQDRRIGWFRVFLKAALLSNGLAFKRRILWLGRRNN